MNKQATRIGIAAASLAALTSIAQATSVIQYVANPNPTNFDGYATQPGFQPWTLNLTAGTAAGTGVIDGGTPAWETPASPANEEYWTLAPTGADVALGNTEGWILSGRVRMPDPGLGPWFHTEVSYLDGSKFWAMIFGTDAEGDPIVSVFDGGVGPSWTNQLAGTGAYHLYQVVYNPVALNVDVLVDGVERISNFTGFAIGGSPVVRWGDPSSTEGHAFYNLVQLEFDPVPEPSVVGLLVAGGALLAGWRRRKQ